MKLFINICTILTVLHFNKIFCEIQMLILFLIQRIGQTWHKPGSVRALTSINRRSYEKARNLLIAIEITVRQLHFCFG